VNKHKFASILILSGILLLGLLAGPIGLAQTMPQAKTPDPSGDTAQEARTETASSYDEINPLPDAITLPPLTRRNAPALNGLNILTLAKRTEGTLVAGTPLTYILTITNTGVSTITQAVITDRIPAGATYVSGGSLVGSGVVTWTDQIIPPDTPIDVSFIVTSCNTSTSLNNNLYRVASSAQGISSTLGPPVVTNLTPPNLLASFNTDPAIVTVGETAYFTSTSTTDGSNIISWGWNFGDTTTGSGETTNHLYATPGDYVVTLTVTDEACGFTDEVTHTVRVREPVLTVTKAGDPESVEAGQNLHYTIIVANTGQGNASGVTISDPLPDHTQFVPGSVNLSPADAGTPGSSPPALATGVKIAAGQQVVLTYDVTVNTPLTDGVRIPNVVSVTSSQVPTPTTDIFTSTVTTTPGVNIVKTGPATARLNETIVFTFAMTNSGNTRLQVIEVRDDITGAATFVDGGDTNSNGWLDLDETWSYTATYLIPPDVTDPLTNTVIVTATDPADPPKIVTDSKSGLTDINYIPALAIAETGPATAAVGETISYTFTVTNDNLTGDGSGISNPVVSSSKINLISFGTGDDNTNNLLEVDETWIYSGSYTVLPTDPDLLQNMATVTGEDLDGEVIPPANDNHIVNVSFTPVLAVVKNGPTTAAVGDQVTYTYDVSHAAGSDSSPVSNVSVSDSLAGMTAIPDSGDTNGDNKLDGGETWRFTLDYTIPPGAPNLLTNMGTVSGVDGDGEAIPAASDGHTLDVSFAPVLKVVKNGPATAAVGDQVTYTFDVSHAPSSDDSPVSNVRISDSLAGMKAAPDSGDTNGNDKLDGGETWRFTLGYTIPPSAPNLLTNVGTVSGVDGDGQAIPAASDDHTLDVSFAPVLAVVKSGPATAAVGDQVTYTFDVSHAPSSDDSPVSNVRISDSLAGMKAAPDSGDTNGNNKLDGGETWRFTLGYTIPPSAPNLLTNMGTVSGVDGDGQAIPAASDDHTLDVSFAPVLAVVKNGPATAAVGDQVTYTFDVSHAPSSDDSPVSSVSLEDDVAGSAVLISGDTNSNNRLDGSETWRFEATYLIPPSAPNLLTNVGTVSGRDKDNDLIQATSNTHILNVSFAPMLAVVKNGPAAAAVGDQVIYTYDVSHTAGSDDSPVSNVSLEDDVAGSAVYVSGDTNGNNKLDASETWRFEVDYLIPPTAPNELVNQGTVSGRDKDNDLIEATSNKHALEVEFAPALSITKIGPSLASVGQGVTYIFSVQNDDVNGDGSPISNVALNDDIIGVPSPLPGGDDGDNLLEVGETWVYINLIPYDIQPTDPSPLVNTVVVVGTDRDGDPVPPAIDTHSLEIDFNPSVSIDKEGPVIADAGETAVYTFTITTGGDNSAVNNVVVTDTIAGPATYVSGDSNLNNAVDQGESWIFTAAYTIQPDDPPVLINEGHVSGQDNNGLSIHANTNHVTIIDFNPVLTITKTGPSVAAVEETADYTFKVSHAPTSDNSVISKVILTDTVAGPVSLIDGDTNSNNQLDAGETWTFAATYTIQLEDPDPLINVVTAGGTDRNGEPVPPASDSHSLDIEHKPALLIQADGPTRAYVGETVFFSYTIYNDDIGGDGSPVSSFSVTDSQAGSATYISGDDGDNLLEAGEAWLYGLSYTIQLDDLGTLPHAGRVDALDADGDPVSKAGNAPDISISEIPELRITKTGPETAFSGESITYTLTVTNIGPVPAHDVVITDALPLETSHLSGGTTVGSVVEWPMIAELKQNEAVTVPVVVKIFDPSVNKDYGVRAAGGIIELGQKSVSTSVTYLAYLPFIRRDLAELYIKNINAGNATINIYKLGEDEVFRTCFVPNNRTVLCATFPPGTYILQRITPFCIYPTVTRLYVSGRNDELVGCE
jgi:uncharacterized repeat protein (TIGR01451 family)